MTYQELYHSVYDDGACHELDTELEHLARTILLNKYEGITEAEDAVYRALELIPEMRGYDIDPTVNELPDIIYYVEHPEYIRARRGLIKAMNNGKLFDFIMQNYTAFRMEDLARIIAEIDCALYDSDKTNGRPTYHKIMDTAAEEIKNYVF